MLCSPSDTPPCNASCDLVRQPYLPAHRPPNGNVSAGQARPRAPVLPCTAQRVERTDAGEAQGPSPTRQSRPPRASGSLRQYIHCRESVWRRGCQRGDRCRRATRQSGCRECLAYATLTHREPGLRALWIYRLPSSVQREQASGFSSDKQEYGPRLTERRPQEDMLDLDHALATLSPDPSPNSAVAPCTMVRTLVARSPSPAPMPPQNLRPRRKPLRVRSRRNLPLQEPPRRGRPRYLPLQGPPRRGRPRHRHRGPCGPRGYTCHRRAPER